MKQIGHIPRLTASNWLSRAASFTALLLACACSGPEFVEPGADGGDVQADLSGDSNIEDEEQNADGETGQDASACDETCDGDTPFCHEDTAECVTCLSDTDCGNAERCTDGGVCVDCLDDDDCADGVCIEGDAPEANHCEMCRTNEECTEANASVCSEDNTCQGCGDDGDCAHLSDAKRCLVGSGDSQCVECLTDEDCGGMVCDQLEHVCTDTSPGSGEQCGSCVSDTQCGGDRRCIALTFEGSHHGYYCLELASSEDSCEGPYPAFENRTSLGGETEDFCLPNESVTTCEAVLDFMDFRSDQCESGGSLDDSLCGAPSVDDGLCRDFDGSFSAKCSYRCETDADCASQFMLKCGNAASGGVGPDWCGGGE